MTKVLSGRIPEPFKNLKGRIPGKISIAINGTIPGKFTDKSPVGASRRIPRVSPGGIHEKSNYSFRDSEIRISGAIYEAIFVLISGTYKSPMKYLEKT